MKTYTTQNVVILFDKDKNRIYEEYDGVSWYRYKYNERGDRIYELNYYGHWYVFLDGYVTQKGQVYFKFPKVSIVL